MQWLQDTFAALTAEDSGQAPTDTAPETKYTALTLQKDGQLSREQLLAFFSSASKVMKAENFRRKLKDARLLKQDVEDMITDMQKEVFEEQGIDGNHGVEFLGQINTVYKTDDAILAELLKFASLEEDTLDEVEMSEADYQQKQRLMAIAKAHTAQLMNKMDALPPEERQAFLKSQMEVAEQLRTNIAAGQAKMPAPASLSSPQAPQEQSLNSMSPQEMMQFFKQQRS